MSKIWDALNATLVIAKKTDLVLTQDDINLMGDLIKELEPFHTITNLLCTNTKYSFNNYLPMKEVILNLLNKKVDLTNTSSHIVDFREIMLEQFKKFELSEKTLRLAKTASLLDPSHMVKAPDGDLQDLIDHVVQILEEDVPAAAAPETQAVGPSQHIVSTSVNIPKPRDSKPTSVFAKF